jgi:hypothetical protein
MKHLRIFDSVADLNTAIANSTIGMIGLAYDNGTPVMKKKETPPPTPPTPTATTDMFIFANPTSRGRINVDALTNLREHEATYTVGTQIELTAVPLDGSEFIEWKDDENHVVSTNASFTYTVPDVGYRELNAFFRQTVIRYNVSAVVTPANAGFVAGTGRVAENDQAQLLFTCDNEHYHYDGWSYTNNRADIQGTSPYVAFTVTEDTTVYFFCTLVS